MVLPPEEREYHVLGAMRQCERCYRIKAVELSHGDVASALESARRVAKEEWADPEYRAWLERHQELADLWSEAAVLEALSEGEFMDRLSEMLARHEEGEE